MPVFDGGCAQGALGRAGLLSPRSTNLRTAASPCLVARGLRLHLQDLVHVQTYTESARGGPSFPANQIQNQEARRSHQSRLGLLPATKTGKVRRCSPTGPALHCRKKRRQRVPPCQPQRNPGSSRRDGQQPGLRPGRPSPSYCSWYPAIDRVEFVAGESGVG